MVLQHLAQRCLALNGSILGWGGGPSVSEATTFLVSEGKYCRA